MMVSLSTPGCPKNPGVVDEEPELNSKAFELLSENRFWELCPVTGPGDASSSSSSVSTAPRFVEDARLHSTSALFRTHLQPPALHLTQDPPSYSSGHFFSCTSAESSILRCYHLLLFRLISQYEDNLYDYSSLTKSNILYETASMVVFHRGQVPHQRSAAACPISTQNDQKAALMSLLLDWTRLSGKACLDD